MSLDLFGRRSALFLPASNPRAIAKARTAGADLVILDLEDAVRPEDKDAARAAAVEAVAFAWPCPVAIRINGLTSEWHRADEDAVAGSAADLVVLPRCEDEAQLRLVQERTRKRVAAMIETPAGVLASPRIARSAAALIAGTNDLRSALRLPPGAGRDRISASLQLIVLAARVGGIPAFDGVFNGLDDAEGFRAEAQDGRMLGFDGKSLIHPNQIALCHEAWAPTGTEIARAERLVAAAQGGAERFEGEMIERMHVEAAERLLSSRHSREGGDPSPTASRE
ncbi:HpcH/HpaI aldolase/citrate lyase family protein [Sphingomonas sp. GCM10030256]|uniref:HpcH/HpaI aldolase/citrate lyase family protein n=1 Tax=Sphingomonas sp. GCM10030256 TaxID=3273427 RepID=UPI00360BE71D